MIAPTLPVRPVVGARALTVPPGEHVVRRVTVTELLGHGLLRVRDADGVCWLAEREDLLCVEEDRPCPMNPA